jgi:hypothetical protein
MILKGLVDFADREGVLMSNLCVCVCVCPWL